MAPKRAHIDPEGARARPKHGNFSSYYSIRAEHASSESSRSIGRGRDASESKRPTHVSSGSVDPRLDVMVKHIQQHVKTFTGGASSNDKMHGAWPTRILDVGCNEGRMTCAMASAFPNAQSHGVDIDESLIKRAGAYARRMGFSPCVNPPRCTGVDKEVASSAQEQSPAHLAFHTADWPRLSIERAVLTSQRHISDVAPFQHTTELLASRRQESRELCLSALAREDDQGWDVILALSITKWIHLSHSDLGIRHFFSRIAQTLSKRPLGGVLILEPQPWKSYEQARRVIGAEGRRRHKKLRLRPEDFQFVLTMELGFAEPVRLGQTAGYGFSRDLYAYHVPPAERTPACYVSLRDQICSEAERLARHPLDGASFSLHDRSTSNDQAGEDTAVAFAWVARPFSQRSAPRPNADS